MAEPTELTRKCQALDEVNRCIDIVTPNRGIREKGFNQTPRVELGFEGGDKCVVIHSNDIDEIMKAAAKVLEKRKSILEVTILEIVKSEVEPRVDGRKA